MLQGTSREQRVETGIELRSFSPWPGWKGERSASSSDSELKEAILRSRRGDRLHQLQSFSVCGTQRNERLVE